MAGLNIDEKQKSFDSVTTEVFLQAPKDRTMQTEECFLSSLKTLLAQEKILGSKLNGPRRWVSVRERVRSQV